ncbi:hypothetical protein Leryth_027590 [Lithospermum erythrorhizon]|nr:hypothetical protein Leryth_027590 [Lithospermum erythrorhizon]
MTTIKGMEMIFLMAMVAALAMLGTTTAQTTHQVGEATGWVVPPGSAAAYASWTSTKTFRVGDILDFVVQFSTLALELTM